MPKVPVLAAAVFATLCAVSLSAETPARIPDKRPHVKRVRPVRPDVKGLAMPGLRRGARMKAERLLKLELFPDAVLLVELTDVEHDPTGVLNWVGRVNGDWRSEAVVSVRGDTMTATFLADGRTYVIQPAPDGEHEAEELDTAAFPAETEPLVAPVAVTAPITAATAADSVDNVDILVGYTHVVRQSLGTAGAESLVSNSVARFNLALENSGVRWRVRLVRSVEVQFDDRTATFGTALALLRGSGDGAMDSLHALRESVGADAVSLVVYYPADNACGLGYLMDVPSDGFAGAAFNVVRADCANGYMSLAHEFGHNFGLAHDRANASRASRPWAYGYQDPEGMFRDVMAYPCGPRCDRLPYFSTPNVLYNGRPFGVPDTADNARALNDNASIIANWRQSADPLATFTDDPLIPGQTEVRAVHLTELRDAINARRARSGLPAVTWEDESPAGMPIKASHIAAMRNALTPSLPVAPTYAETELATVRATHIQELRTLVNSR